MKHLPTATAMATVQELKDGEEAGRRSRPLSCGPVAASPGCTKSVVDSTPFCRCLDALSSRARTALKENLERTGKLRKIRAELRAGVLGCLNTSNVGVCACGARQTQLGSAGVRTYVQRHH